MELLERIHDSLAERNEWLVLKDLMESSQDNPKTSFQAGGEGMPEPKMDTKTLEMSIKADEAAVRFLRKTLSDKKSMVKSYEKTVKWLIKKGAGAHYKTKNHKKQCTRDIPAKKNRPDSGVSRRGILVP